MINGGMTENHVGEVIWRGGGGGGCFSKEVTFGPRLEGWMESPVAGVSDAMRRSQREYRPQQIQILA